ncbi:replication protein [Halomonas sp. DP5N14-9]|uniref:replication protein n=1 Tax=Halomonas sp. DP5N14-9 TaxID=2859075 RepID=UPI001C997189|nr:replication protein [Halomonas sp. DP5N14-9]MBY5942799.1 replication protein [Halomonas sp. DP5N14-9]
MTDTAQIFQFPSAPEAPREKRGPQVEDGYTRIANELFEAVTNSHTCPITLRQMRIVLSVIRKTYGFNKKTDRISDGQLAAATGISRQNVNAAKRELLAMNVLFTDGQKLGVNKAYAEWDFTARPEKDNLKQTRDTVSKAETKNVSKAGSHKRQKDITTADAVVNAQSVRDAFDVFYNAGLPKKDRKRAERKFSALVKRDKRTPGELADFLANDIRKRLASEQQGFELLHPTTYLNNERWLDDYEPASPVVAPGSDIPACPHADILAEWDRHLAAKKGRAPAPVDWEGTRMAGKLEALWAKCWNAKNPSGAVRYDSVESGVQWWSSVFKHLAGSRNFLQSDVTLSNLFNPDTFSLAVNGSLREQGGAVR